MTHDDREIPEPSSEDRKFTERLREAWGSPELTAYEAVAFDRALEERIVRRRRRHLLGLGLMTAVAAAAAMVIAVVSLRSPVAPSDDWVGALAEADAYGRVGSSAVDTLGWGGMEIDEVSEPAWLTWLERTDPDEATLEVLPADYLAIAFLTSLPEKDETGETREN